MITGTVKIDVYNCTIKVMFSKEPEDGFKKYKIPLPEYGVQKFDGMFVCNSDWDNYYIFFLDGVNDGIIAHESLHATNKILKDVGVHSCFENDEAQAYLLQSIFSQIQKIRNKK